MDIFDIDTNVNYEIEKDNCRRTSDRLKQKYRSAGVDLVIISIKHLDTDLGAMNEYLRKWIRPD